MKRLVMIAALTTSLFVPNAAFAVEQTVKLAVGNMFCGSCTWTVKRALTAVPGVTKVVVSYLEKSAVVSFDDQKTTVQALIDATTNAGYPTKLAAAEAPKTQ